MKAITLHQPWASLISAGAKRVETRSWATKHRGPLAIHAASTTKGIESLPGDCEGKQEGDWRYGYIGHYQASYCCHSGDEGQRGETRLMTPSGLEMSLPLGAVVATCNLVGVVSTEHLEWKTDEWVRAADTVGSELLNQAWLSWEWNGQSFATAVHEAQRPFGDFSPGRYAWLLADITPLATPVLANGHQRLWEWIQPKT